MRRREFIKMLLSGTTGMVFNGGCSKTKFFLNYEKTGLESIRRKPNILIIMADDLGFSDLGCYGGEIETPNLDNLAYNGIRFTQFYNSARCCPSRASLLTGLYPHQAGIGLMSGVDNGVRGYRGFLQPNCVTLAEVLRDAGYRTMMSGKWHVGSNPSPTDRGFEEFYGFVRGYSVNCWKEFSQAVPAGLKAGRDDFIRLPEDHPRRDYPEDKFYATDAITDYALDFLKEARNTIDRPWFLCVAYNAPHFPLQAPKEEIKKYSQIYTKGWDHIRRERLDRMRQIGIVPKDLFLSNRSPVPKTWASRDWGDKENPSWDDLPEDRRTDLARRMAIYAAMVDRMDQNVGRILDDIEVNGEKSNTLIMFLSDNGACAEWDPWGFDKKSGTENILHTELELEKMGGPDTFHSYGSAWANACNTPLRLYKHYAHEGGISTPFIVHWPAKIRQPGRIETESVGHIVDIMPTLVDISGADYPNICRGLDVLSMEGVSLAPVFHGKKLNRPNMICWEHEGNRAVRDGKWKLVSYGEAGPWELYDIIADRGEQYNLVSEFPERVKKMAAYWQVWAKRCYVLPRSIPSK